VFTCNTQLWWGNKPAIPNLGRKGNNDEDTTANDDVFTNLHLSNLPLANDKEDEVKLLQQLEELFKQFGDKTIIKVLICKRHTVRCTCC
jgi:hypothetical protein